MCAETKTTSFGRLTALFFFSVAFAYIEAVVVVYLRAIFYPDGFNFPIANLLEKPGAATYMLIEIGREAATVILILTAAYLMVRKFRERVGYFLIIFAVWDIFYYVWLKVLLDWPGSVLDWDILFLIPVTWAGPVLAPVITSVLMLLAGFLLLSQRSLNIGWVRAVGLAGAVLGIIIVFCVGGLKVTEPDYASCFSWPIFGALHAAVVIWGFRTMRRSEKNTGL